MISMNDRNRITITLMQRESAWLYLIARAYAEFGSSRQAKRTQTLAASMSKRARLYAGMTNGDMRKAENA